MLRAGIATAPPGVGPQSDPGRQAQLHAVDPRPGRRTCVRTALVVATTAVLVCLAFLLAGGPAPAAQAAAPGGPAPVAPTKKGAGPVASTQIALDQPSVVGAHVTISGRVLDAQGNAVARANVAVSLDGRNAGGASTDNGGGFSTRLLVPGTGVHDVVAMFAGDGQHTGSSASRSFGVGGAVAPPQAVSNQHANTVLTAAIQPEPVRVGSAFAVVGKLTSATGQPLNQERLDIAGDIAGVTAMTITNADGSFSAGLSMPDTVRPLPATMTVTVSFAGDGAFEATTHQASAPLVAAVAPPRLATPSAVAPSVTGPTLARGPDAVGGGASASDLSDGLAALSLWLTLVILSLTAAALATLAGIWAISRRDTGLDHGERRGFGTDFGAL